MSPRKQFLGAALGFCWAITEVLSIASAEPNFVVHHTIGSAPLDLTRAGDRVFFSADDGLSGRELWRLDQDGTYRMVRDILPGPAGSDPNFLTPNATHLYFFAGNVDASGGFSRQLFATDGTADGTHRISSLTSGLDVLQMVATDWAIVMSARTRTHGLELWASLRDGSTPSGWGPLALVKNFDGTNGDGMSMGPFVVHTDSVIFAALNRPSAGRRSIVWIWREGETSPVPLTTPDGSEITCDGEIEGVSTGNRLFLVSRGEDADLWRFNRALTEIQPVLKADSTVPRPSQLTAQGHLLYFVYQGESVGRELFKLDSSTGLIDLVADLNPGPEHSSPYNITPLRDGIVFNATREDVGTELWGLFPEHESPILLGDFVPGAESSRPYSHHVYDDFLYFSCDNPVHGEELWRSDGTPEGTRLVADLNPGDSDSEPYSLTILNSALYFTARAPHTGEEVWRLSTDDQLPTLATRIRPALVSVRSTPIADITADDDVAYFVTSTPETGGEIWRSDGTEEGTQLLLDLLPGSVGSNPSNLSFDIDRKSIRFLATNSDGTQTEWDYHGADKRLRTVEQSENTQPVHTVKALLWSPLDVAKLDERLVSEDASKLGHLNLFAAWTQSLGRELWILPDGEHYPSMLADICPGPASGNPGEFVSTGRFAVFKATGPDNRASVWITDGTAQGTKSVGVGVPEDAVNWTYGVAMIVRTVDGRRRLMTYSPDSGILIPHLTEWQERSLNIRNLRATTNRLFFIATHPSFGEELWCTDSLGWENTRMVRDLSPNRAADATEDDGMETAP